MHKKLFTLMLALSCSVFLVAKKSENLALDKFYNIFVEDYDSKTSGIIHIETTDNMHSNINGGINNKIYKTHFDFGPDYGVIIRYSDSSSVLDIGGGAQYSMPGFNWDTKFENDNISYSAKAANFRLHSRKDFLFGNMQLVPYSGIDYIDLSETIKTYGARNTKLFYLPVGFALMPKSDIVLQMAVSKMLYGNVSLAQSDSAVSNGYGVLLGVLWHKSDHSNCHLDLSLKNYLVANDSFAFSSNIKSNVDNKIYSWNAKCDVSL